jgi:hypothetical protein
MNAPAMSLQHRSSSMNAAFMLYAPEQWLGEARITGHISVPNAQEHQE